MKTRAVILAAGRGSRMGAATEKSHKCLTPLGGKPLLSWQTEALRRAGIDDITVVKGYRAGLLTGDFAGVINPRWSETNMVYTLFCTPPFAGVTVVSYADIVYKAGHVQALLEQEGDIAITADRDWYRLWESRFENPLEDAETIRSDGDRLVAIGGKTDDPGNIEAQYMGLLKFSEEGWATAYRLFRSLPAERQDKIDMTGLLAALLETGEKISVAFVQGGWCEVDNYSDVTTYEKAITGEKRWHHDWR